MKVDWRDGEGNWAVGTVVSVPASYPVGWAVVGSAGERGNSGMGAQRQERNDSKVALYLDDLFNESYSPIYTLL